MTHAVITLVLAFVVLWIIAKILLLQPKSIRGKVVLITGSANGMGRVMVKKFAELGCSVACVDMDNENNQTIVNKVNSTHPGSAKAYSCNIALAEDIEKLKEQVQNDFGVVNILVNNAAILYHNSSPVENNDEYMNAIITINLTAQIMMVNAFLPDMLKHNEGHVVAISSMAVWVPSRQFGLYATTKGGIKSYMDSLALKLENIPNNKVKTTIAYPCLTDTQPFLTECFKNSLEAMPPDYVASVIIRGVMKGYRQIFIPHGFRYISLLFEFLPLKLIHLIMKKYEPDIGLLTEERCREYRLDTIVPVTNRKIADNARRNQS